MEEEAGGWEDDEDDAIGEAKKVGEGGKRCCTACGSLLVGSARSAMPNPGGTGYTPFPAHPLDMASTLHFPSSSFRRIPSPFLLYSLSVTFLYRFSLSLPSLPPPSLVTLHKVAICGRLSRSPIRLPPFLLLLRSSPPYHDLLALTMPSSHPLATPLSEYSVHLPPASILGSLALLPPLLLSSSLSCATPPAIGAPKRGGQASQIRSRDFGSARSVPERRPEGFASIASMRRAALPARCMY